MNIFVLSENPVEAAHFHCDQHLHKMILESAQMLSTAAHQEFPHLSRHIYQPAYEKHPCTQWVSASPNHMVWLCALANTLNEIRENHGGNRHSSMDIIDAIEAQFDSKWTYPSPAYFAEAMFPHIKCRTDLTTTEKYRLYYQKKHLQWRLDTKRGMTYKGRFIPDFMQNILEG